MDNNQNNGNGVEPSVQNQNVEVNSVPQGNPVGGAELGGNQTVNNTRVVETNPVMPPVETVYYASQGNPSVQERQIPSSNTVVTPVNNTSNSGGKRGVPILVWIALLIILAGAAYYFVFGLGGDNSNTNNNSNTNENNNNTGSGEDMDSVEAMDYLSVLRIKDRVGESSGANVFPALAYKSTKLLASDLTSKQKMEMAFMNAKTSVEQTLEKDGVTYSYYTEEQMKTSFIGIFGSAVTFENVDKFNSLCLEDGTVYNATDKRYEFVNACGPVTSFTFDFLMVSAKEYSDRIEIVESPGFLRFSETDNKMILYSDYDLTIEVAKLDVVTDSIYTTAISQYKDQLSQFKYTFNKDSVGNYYFYSIEKVK